MFPKQTLDAEDLFALAPQGAVVTIEKVDFKTYDSGRVGDAEISYFLFTREFKKPFRLNKQNAQTIEQVLGSDETDEWIGRTIMVCGVKKKITDRDTGKPKQIWVIDVDMMAPRSAPTLPPKQDITGLAASNRPTALPPGVAAHAGALSSASGQNTIGIDKAVEIAAVLEERGKSLADLAAHLDSIGMGGHIAGKELPDWPFLIIAVAKKFCQGFPRCNPSSSPERKAAIRARWEAPPGVNPATGEVIPEDDIPF